MGTAISEPAAELELVRDLERAAVLLSPLRIDLLERARTPKSATELGQELGLPRQKVNYHVRELARGGFLRRAGRRKRRAFKDQCYVATARGYVLAPELLGPLAADPSSIRDRIAPAYLLALAARMQRELAGAAREADARDRKVAALAIEAELRFESAAQERAFAAALADALGRVIEEHSSPARAPNGSPGRGRPFRLVLGCHPIPDEV